MACCIATSAVAKEVTVVDQAGRTVTVQQPVERVVTTFIPATIFALSAGLADALVGASTKDGTSSIYEALIDPENPPTLVGNRSVGLNLETITSLKPDLVIMYGQKDGIRLADRLTDLGIPAIVIMPEKFVDMRESLDLIGRASGRKDHTDRVNSALLEIEERLESRTSIASTPVYYAASDLLRTVSGDMLQNDMIYLAGGRSVSEKTTGFFVNISREQLVAWNPEIIICSDRLTDKALTRLNSREFEMLKAKKTGKVFRVPQETYWDFPSPLAMAGVLWMNSMIQPEAYSDTTVQDEIDTLYNIIFGEGFAARNPKVVGKGKG